MTSPVLMAALLAIGPSAPDRPSPAASGAAKADRLVCLDLAETGSRLARRRVCMTRGAWAEFRRLQRDELERMQVNAGIPGVD
jgi:hypothetical protein